MMRERQVQGCGGRFGGRRLELGWDAEGLVDSANVIFWTHVQIEVEAKEEFQLEAVELFQAEASDIRPEKRAPLKEK